MTAGAVAVVQRLPTDQHVLRGERANELREAVRRSPTSAAAAAPSSAAALCLSRCLTAAGPGWCLRLRLLREHQTTGDSNNGQACYETSSVHLRQRFCKRISRLRRTASY